MSPSLQNAECPVFKWLDSRLGQMECPLLISQCHKSRLSINVSADLTLLWKWLDRCDDSGLSFCLKVIKLCPPNSAPQMHISTTSHTILTSFHFIFPGLHVLNFRWPPYRIMVSSSYSSLDCKLTWISVENIRIRAVFWIASLHLVFPGLFYLHSYPVHYFLALIVSGTQTSEN